MRSRWVLEVLLHLAHSAQFSAVKKVRRRHRVKVKSGRDNRRLRMTAWSLEDTISAGSSAGVVNGRPWGCSSDVVEVDEGRETASARRAASRAAHVEVETICGELEGRDERKDETRSRRRRRWRACSRHCAKEAARSSRLAMVGTIRASGSSSAGPGMIERRLRPRRAEAARRMARASKRPSRSVTMASVTTSAGGPRGADGGEVAGVECRVSTNSEKKASAAGEGVLFSYCRMRASG